jgi:hypothetical protein
VSVVGHDHFGIGWPARRGGFRYGHGGSTSVGSAEDLVRHNDVGVQIRVAGPAVPVGERGGNQASDVDLPDPLRSGLGEQGMLLNER